MAAKCDIRLNWWIRLANLYRGVLPTASDTIAGEKGFSGQVEKLSGPRPEEVDALFRRRDRPRHLLTGAGNDPDTSLWGLAGVANSILSNMSELGETRKVPTELVIADWSTFTAPVILAISNSGEVVEAYRPEPLVNDLLSILRGKSVRILGTCPICNKLFERLRKDQMCDSRHCRDAHRQRRHRAEQPRYEANRRRYRKERFRPKLTRSLSAALRENSGVQRDEFLEMMPLDALAKKKSASQSKRRV